VETSDGAYVAALRAPDGIHFAGSGAERFAVAIARYLEALVA
jgi:lysophospholipase L1-like esterase